MKILHLGKYYYPHSGGVETYTQTIAESLVKKSHDVEVIVNNKERESKIDYVNKVKVIRLSRLTDLFHAPFSKFPFAYIKKSGFDIIHLHVPNPWLELNLLAYFLFFGKKERFVVTYHADVPHYTAFHRIMDYFRTCFTYPLLKIYADSIIPTSENYIDGSFFLRKLRNKITVAPIGIDTKSYFVDKKNLEQTKRKYKIGSGKEKIILFYGRLVKYKGVEYLLEAFSMLNKKNVRLFIVGDGDLSGKLRAKAKNLGLSNIVFTGHVNNATMNSFRFLADIFVLPSINRGEAFGISIIEAMYFKKPVVTTNIKNSGVAYVNDGLKINSLNSQSVVGSKTGLIVEPKNSKELSDAIDYLLSNTKIAEKLGENGYNRAIQNFTEEKFTDRINKIYESLKKQI